MPATVGNVFDPKLDRVFRFGCALRYQRFEFPVPVQRYRATSADQRDTDSAIGNCPVIHFVQLNSLAGK